MIKRRTLDKTGLLTTALLAASLLLPIESWAGAWTLPKGRVWLKSAVFYQSTDRRFCTEQDAFSLAFRESGCTAAGHSAPFDPFIGGKSTALAVFTEMAYGATGWLDLGVQIPFYSLRFTNLADPDRPRNNGLGDIRFFAKYRLLQRPLVASLMVAAKSPTGEFNIDAEAVNVSEGQWDFDVMGEMSKSFWPFKGYASLGAGYRFRADNPDFDRTMANEFLLHGEVGYDVLPNLMLKGEADWLRGQYPRLELNEVRLLERRELLTLASSVIYRLSEELSLEASARFAISGRDYPDGHQLMGAISYGFSIL